MPLFLIFVFLSLQSVCLSISIPYKQSGESLGILESKGEAWVEIREDEGFRNRYLAPWVGGSPSKGGHFDERVLGIIKDAVVGNRVRIKWNHDGHLRIQELAVVVPREKYGVFTGNLVEIGNHWVDFENPEDRIPWRFYLRWIGGYPEDGGGYDGKAREELVARKEDALFRFQWSYDVRPRFVRLLRLEGYVEPPFYENEDVPVKEEKEPPPAPVNPFDLPAAPTVNPFDQMGQPAVNPFDQAPAPTVNPFDQTPPPLVNPFDQTKPPKVNPFDQAPSPTVNPFDGEKKAPVNPFDSAPKSQVNPFDQLPGNSK